MDTVAYVYMKKKEFVFIKGSVFNEATQVKEYDQAYSLVSPCSLAPMVLLLRGQQENDKLMLDANTKKDTLGMEAVTDSGNVGKQPLEEKGLAETKEE